MFFPKHAVISCLSLSLVLGARPAMAEEVQLHYAEGGALLAYADAEAVLLNGALTAREFDPELVAMLVGELERAVSDAKRMIDRAQILLGDEKLAGDFTKVLEALRRAEGQVAKLKADIERETASKAEPSSDHRDDEASEAEPASRDWSLLRTGVGWLYADIKDARTMHAMLGKRLKGAPLKAPTRPTTKR